MRVLHAFKDYFPPTFGGIEQHISDVVHGLRDVHCTVLTSSRRLRRRVDDDRGVRVVRTPELGRLWSTPVTPTWTWELRRNHADLLHFHMPNPVGEMALVASGTPSPLVVTYHADVTRAAPALAAYRRLQQHLLARAVRIVVASPAMTATSVLAAHRDRTVVVPYGTEAHVDGAVERAAAQIRHRYGGPLVLFLGRLVHYKGVEVLVEAMADVDAIALVVGDGPLRRPLEHLVRRRGLSGRVRFTGQTSEAMKPAYYLAADVFVLPATSRAEAFGIAMLEAMSFGTPAISTEVGTGTSWVNVDGLTGAVVPPCDRAALAHAVRSLLGDDGRRRTLGAAAAARVRRDFGRERMLASLVAVYRDALEGNGPSPSTRR